MSETLGKVKQTGGNPHVICLSFITLLKQAVKNGRYMDKPLTKFNIRLF